MKKNKTIAYMMAATLLVGGTFMGTKAWFSDKAETDNGIKITMGNLDLQLLENGSTEEGKNFGWKLVRDGEEESLAGKEIEKGKLASSNDNITDDHINIRPGDKFTRTFTIKNNGSLDQQVAVSHNINTSIGDEYSKLFTLDIETEDGIFEDYEFRLNAGESKEVTMNLTPIADKLSNEYQNGKFSFEELFGTTKLTGRQINAAKDQLSPEHK